MKKTLLIICCLLAGLSISAQDTKIAIKSATASSAESGNDASKAIDGDKSTIWHSTWSSATQFPVTFTITLSEETHVDYVRYIPRQDGSNGNWDVVYVAYCPTTTGNDFSTIGQFTLNGVSSQSDLWLTDDGVTCGQIKFTIESGSGRFASAAEIEVYAVDNSYRDMYAQYFTDAVFSELKPEVTSSEGIEDVTLKTLVDNLLNNKEEYKKFRVGEYEPYLSTATLNDILKVSSYYNNYENPTGVYLKAGESCVVAVSGINSNYPVGLKIKNWVENEHSSSYSLRNGINQITASTEGNVFVNYYTDDFENAPNVKVHFINAPVQGYWDQATMTNEDWVKMLEGRSKDDNTILITRSEHAQLAYPVSAWLQHCPTNVDSTMTLYQQVQWAQRNLLGLEKYGRQVKNRQLYYATTYGFMAAGGEGAYCNVTSLGAIMVPDSKQFDLWGVGHEWGHNNQVTTGFKWSGCGETTNNIYASWGQIYFTGNRDAKGNPTYLRLEDETSGVDEYSGMRGGRMQTYFEEGLRKGVAWQLQDGPDYHGATPETKSVPGINADGYMTGSMVTTTTRNYDHFVKLVPFWQLNLWGTLAGKCPDIIPMVIESIRTTKNYTSYFNSNGKKQINWMKLACDSAKINLLPFFEKAGMLRPINAYIEDYSPGWNIITEEMIAELKDYVETQNYPAFTEEINYINGHNYRTYRDGLKLEVPEEMNTGCQLNGNKVTIQHSQVKNAVAFETYNFKGDLLRITMYGLGSNDSHSFTQVLYPKSSDIEFNSAYIMAVGYDGERVKVFQEEDLTAIMKRAFLNLLNEAKEYQHKTDTTGTKIGYLLPDSIIGFTAFVNELNSLVENTDETTHTYEEWYYELQDAIETLNANTSARVSLIPGSFYTLGVSNKERQYIDNANAGLKTTESNAEETPESMQWRLVETSNNDTYYIQHRTTGNYISYVVSGKRVKAEAEKISDAVAFTLAAQLPGEFFIQCADDATIRLYNYGQNNQVFAGNQTGANAKWAITLEDDMLALPDVSNDEQITIYYMMRNDNGEYAYSYMPKSSDKGRIASGMYSDSEDFDFWFYFKQGSQDGKYTIHNYGTGKAATERDGKLFIDKDAETIPEYTIALDEQGKGLIISSEEGNWFMNGSSTELAEINAEESTAWRLQRSRTISLTDEPITSLTINKTEATLLEGEDIQLTVETAPVYASDHSVTWSSSDENIAIVDSTGKVVGVSAGKATITATANDNSGLKVTCTVTVKKNQLTSLTINKTKATLIEGDSITLTVKTKPSSAPDHSVTWSSSDENVATVDANGKVIAIAAGKATITVTANDGSGLTATCEVTVQKKDSGIFNTSTATLSIQAVDGTITIDGLTKGSTVTVYSIMGKQLATVTSASNTVIINTGLTKGNIAIILVDNYCVKMQME